MNLTAKHLLFIDMLADPCDQRTNKAKAKDAGWSPRHTYTMLRDSDFLTKLHERTTILVAARRAEIYGHLRKSSNDGDTAAAVAFLKGCGDIQGGTNVVTNVSQNNSDKDLINRYDAVRRLRSAKVKASITDEDSE